MTAKIIPFPTKRPTFSEIVSQQPGENWHSLPDDWDNHMDYEV